MPESSPAAASAPARRLKTFAYGGAEHAYLPRRSGLLKMNRFGGSRGAAPLNVMRTWPGYAPTPLRLLRPLAASLGLNAVLYKDESTRFGLGSFKPMGAAYAVTRAVDRALGLPGASSFSRAAAAIAEKGAPFTVACATDGNHGRAVAWASARLGLRCVVFLHAGVSPARERAITDLGAVVRRVAGNYDDSVLAADREARRSGWKIISDTAYGREAQSPIDVTHGYAGLAAEIALDLQGANITHIFAQAGVGGLAAALFSHFARLNDDTPVNIVVEPRGAGCLMTSARLGALTTVSGSLETVMAGLSCGAPSLVAWRIIQTHDTHFLTIGDDSAVGAMRLLADPRTAGAGIVAGESGGAGLAGLIEACGDSDLRQRLQLDRQSVVLLVGTEGATDADCYRRLVGRSPESVLSAEAS